MEISTSGIVFGAGMLICSLALLQDHAAGGSDAHLPNLVVVAPKEVTLGTSDDGSGPALRFWTSVANRGAYALDVLQVPESISRASGFQCITWSSGTCVKRRSAGPLTWHPEHGHFHFENFVLYELRTFGRGRLVERGTQGLAVEAGKASFCLSDTEPDRPRASRSYLGGNPTYYCGTPAGFQGISPSWRDSYAPTLSGQYISIDGLPSGRYALVFTVDPLMKLSESNESDNRTVIGIEIDREEGRITPICKGKPGSWNCDRELHNDPKPG